METILQVQDLNKVFNLTYAIQNAGFSLAKGEALGIVGPEGAGKSTLIKLLAGIRRPTSGTIHYAKRRMKIGVLLSTPEFIPSLTGEQVLQYFRIQHGLPRSTDVSKLLTQVDLFNVRKKPTRSYSEGMKQRLGLAVALLGEPDLLLLDEPFLHLDPAGTALCREVLQHPKLREHCAIVITNREASTLSHLVDRILQLDNGELLPMPTTSFLDMPTRVLRIVTDAPQKALTVCGKLPHLRCSLDADGALLVEQGSAEAPEIIRTLVEQGIGIWEVKPLPTPQAKSEEDAHV